jgi:hypothetical protein
MIMFVEGGRGGYDMYDGEYEQIPCGVCNLNTEQAPGHWRLGTMRSGMPAMALFAVP